MSHDEAKKLPTDAERDFHQSRAGNMEGSGLDRQMSVTWLVNNGFASERRVPQTERPSSAEFTTAIGKRRTRGLKIVGSLGTGDASSLPKNLDSERIVIASLAHDPGLAPSVADFLAAEDFSLALHRRVFDAIVELNGQGKPLDSTLLLDEVRKKGGAPVTEDELAELLRAAPDSSALRDHALIVRKHAQARRLIEATQAVVRDSANAADDPETFLEEARSRMEAVISLQISTGWPQPQYDALLPAVPFPLEVLPESLGMLAREVSELACCPVDYFLVPCLSLAGAAIGRSVALHIKPRWSECAILWTAFVGRPGTSKTAPLKQATEPLLNIFKETKFDHSLMVERRKEEKKAAAAKRRARGGAAPPTDGDEVPKLERVFVDDTTFEALAGILAENPRGVIEIRDELSGFATGMGQYKGGKGDDREKMLSLWSGVPLAIDRKGQEGHVPTFLPHPFFALTGAIQPDKLRYLQGEQGLDDGLIDRLLFAYPDPVEPVWREELLSDSSMDHWDRAIRRLRRRPMISGEWGEQKPALTTFTPEAKRRWVEWWNALSKEFSASDFPDHLRGPWSKFRTHGARLCLLLDQLHHAYEPEFDGAVRPVGERAVEGSIKLVDYFKVHFRRVYATIQGEKHENAAARAIVEWARKSNRSQFSLSDIRDNFRRSFADKPQALREGINWLLQRSCIRRVVQVKTGPGRTPAERFEVNPSLLKAPAKSD